MRYAITLLLSLLYLDLFAQDFGKEINKTAITAGYKNDQTPINATQYSFPHKVLLYDIDTISGEITLALESTHSKKNIITSINLNDGMVRWSKKSSARSYIITGDVLVEQFSNGTSRAVNRSDGKLRWERKPSFVYADQKQHIGITSEGVAYDLHTGNEIWMRNLDFDKGWTEHFMANDSTLVIVAAQTLHSINIRTSGGWKYNQNPDFLKNSERQLAVSSAFFVGGIVAGAIAYSAVGGYQAPTSNRTFMPSNLVVDTNRGYIITNRKIACMAGDSTKWETDAPEGFNAQSILILSGNELWISRPTNINELAKKKSKAPLPNIPLILFLNKETGQIKSQFAFDLTADFKDVMIKNDTVLVLLDKKLLKLHPKTHRLLQQINIDSTLITELHSSFFNTKGYYTSAEGSYIRINELYPGSTFLSGSGDYIIRLDGQFRFQDSLQKSHFLMVRQERKGIQYMNALGDNKGTTLVKDGKYYGYIKSNNLVISNNKIVYVTDNGINIIEAITE